MLKNRRPCLVSDLRRNAFGVSFLIQHWLGVCHGSPWCTVVGFFYSYFHLSWLANQSPLRTPPELWDWSWAATPTWHPQRVQALALRRHFLITPPPAQSSSFVFYEFRNFEFPIHFQRVSVKIVWGRPSLTTCSLGYIYTLAGPPRDAAAKIRLLLSHFWKLSSIPKIRANSKITSQVSIHQYIYSQTLSPQDFQWQSKTKKNPNHWAFLSLLTQNIFTLES